MTSPVLPAAPDEPPPFALSQLAPTSAVPRRKRKTKLIVIGSCVLALALVAAGTVVWWTNRTITISGSLELHDSDGYSSPSNSDDCTGKDGYADIHQGVQVTVTDATGKVVGVGQLDQGKYRSLSCVFRFTVEDVPPGGKWYGVQVGNNEHRGVMRFPEEKVAGEEIQLFLG